MSTKNESLFKVIFMSEGKVEEIVFGENTNLVVDPSEEKLKSEFSGVLRSYIPLHNVIRIDEVEKRGLSKISKSDGDNVTPFPSPIYTPTSG